MVTLASSSLCSTSTSSKSTISCLSSCSSLKLCHKKAKFGVATLIPQLGLGSLPQWDGLKHLAVSVTPKCIKKEKRRRFKGMVVRASLFGVGAPEALVIGVVALLVFGPKGLAEVARNLGKTLRDFQPAIKELQEVSSEFKSTLEKEIGLDEISSELRRTYNSNKGSAVPTPSSTVKTENSPITPDPNGASSPNRAYSSEDYLKMTEDQLKASASQQQAQIAPLEGSQLEPQPQSQGLSEMPSFFFDIVDGASSPNSAYSSEDYLKVTEEQLKASAFQQQAQIAPLEGSQLDPQPQSQVTQEQAATTTPSAEKPENQA